MNKSLVYILLAHIIVQFVVDKEMYAYHKHYDRHITAPAATP